MSSCLLLIIAIIMLVFLLMTYPEIMIILENL